MSLYIFTNHAMASPKGASRYKWRVKQYLTAILYTEMRNKRFVIQCFLLPKFWLAKHFNLLRGWGNETRWNLFKRQTSNKRAPCKREKVLSAQPKISAWPWNLFLVNFGSLPCTSSLKTVEILVKLGIWMKCSSRHTFAPICSTSALLARFIQYERFWTKVSSEPIWNFDVKFVCFQIP